MDRTRACEVLQKRLLRRTLDFPGADRVLFSTDYPFPRPAPRRSSSSSTPSPIPQTALSSLPATRTPCSGWPGRTLPIADDLDIAWIWWLFVVIAPGRSEALVTLGETERPRPQPGEALVIQAAALPLAGLTALRLLRIAGNILLGG